jgi:ABC-type multidrug transport system ATPase subunit
MIIAHRLSTIRRADKIIVLHHGEVVEEGTHDSLMQARGAYFGLVEHQNLHQAEDNENLASKIPETTQMFPSNQDIVDVRRKRTSTIVSLTSSVLATLHGKKNSIIDENDSEKIDKVIVKERIKVFKNENFYNRR